MKLGIKIVFTSMGVQNGPAFNNIEVLNRYASDVRPYLRKAFPTREQLKSNGNNPLTSFDESSKIVFLLQFVGEQGYIITAIKASPEMIGRVFDNTAVWIHFPLNIDISNKETQDLLQGLSEIISDPSGIDQNKLKAIADRDYCTNDASIMPLLSKGEKMAIMCYGHGMPYQLSEILGSKIRQPEFAKYEAVFLIDNSLQLSVWDTVTNLSNFRIKPMVQVKAPGEKDGFKPYIEDVQFAKPIEIIKGEKLKVVWKRDGFKDIPMEVDTNKDATITVPYPQPNQIDFIFHKNWFQVVNDKKEPIKNYQLSINGKYFDDINDTLVLNYDSIKDGFNISITAPRYDQLKMRFKLQQLTRGYVFTMNRTMYHYEFVIPAYDDNGNKLRTPVYAQLDTSTPINHCPINGYGNNSFRVFEGEGFKNKLIYYGAQRKAMLLSALVGAVAVALIWGIVAFFQHYEFMAGWPPIQEKKEMVISKEPTQKSAPEVQVDKDKSTVSEAAIKYLSENKVWDKTEMEKIDDLKDLYDDMNTFRLDRLTGKWHNKFTNVSSFENIYNCALTARKEQYDPGKGRPEGKYNKDNDTKIDIDNYCRVVYSEPKTDVKNSSTNVPTKSQTVHPGKDTEPKVGSTERGGDLIK